MSSMSLGRSRRQELLLRKETVRNFVMPLKVPFSSLRLPCDDEQASVVCDEEGASIANDRCCRRFNSFRSANCFSVLNTAPFSVCKELSFAIPAGNDFNFLQRFTLRCSMNLCLPIPECSLLRCLHQLTSRNCRRQRPLKELGSFTMFVRDKLRNFRCFNLPIDLGNDFMEV